VSKAPDPTLINWENHGFSNKMRLLRVVTIAIVFFVFLAVNLVLIVRIKVFERNYEINHADDCGDGEFCPIQIAMSLLPATVIVVVNYITKKLMYLFASLERWPEKTQELSNASRNQTL
jgi:hypothetical protein